MSVGDSFSNTVMNGSLLLALVVAGIAGLVSFLSPCVLPLVPGYLSYVTGLTGLDLASAKRGRMLLGTLLFVLGFTVVFVSYGVLFGGLGTLLLREQAWITRVLGVVTIVLGLVFMGYVPGLQREWRIYRAPTLGLVGAPVLGVLFAIGWVPCIGPTLGTILTLAVDQASAVRGALLSAAYCLGLGIPFVLAAVAFRYAMGTFGWVKQHYVWVMRIGGGMLVLIGLLLLTGAWDALMTDLRGWSARFGTAV
jgi:cytochrome c-type biogenesis protein